MDHTTALKIRQYLSNISSAVVQWTIYGDTDAGKEMIAKMSELPQCMGNVWTSAEFRKLMDARMKILEKIREVVQTPELQALLQQLPVGTSRGWDLLGSTHIQTLVHTLRELGELLLETMGEETWIKTFLQWWNMTSHVPPTVVPIKVVRGRRRKVRVLPTHGAKDQRSVRRVPHRVSSNDVYHFMESSPTSDSYHLKQKRRVYMDGRVINRHSHRCEPTGRQATHSTMNRKMLVMKMALSLFLFVWSGFAVYGVYRFMILPVCR